MIRAEGHARTVVDHHRRRPGGSIGWLWWSQHHAPGPPARQYVRPRMETVNEEANKGKRGVRHSGPNKAQASCDKGRETVASGPRFLANAADRGLQARFGRPGCALNRPTWSAVKGSSARVSPIRSGIVVRQRFFGIPATDTDIISAQHFWTGGLETAGPGCY